MAVSTSSIATPAVKQEQASNASDTTSIAATPAAAKPQKPAFVPIRPAFRPLLPKPCSASAPAPPWQAPTRPEASTSLSITRKGRKSLSSKDHRKPVAKRRTKSANAGDSVSPPLPATIAPSSLISKRKKSPAGTGLSSLLSSTQAAAPAAARPADTGRTIKRSSSQLSLSRESSPSLDSDSLVSPVLSASEASLGESVSDVQASTALKLTKKAANVMLSSAVSASDMWTASPIMSVWESTSDHEDITSVPVSDGEMSPAAASLSLLTVEPAVEEDPDATALYSPDMVLTLESYLTPEPDDSEIPTYDPLEFLGPAINIF